MLGRATAGGGGARNAVVHRVREALIPKDPRRSCAGSGRCTTTCGRQASRCATGSRLTLVHSHDWLVACFPFHELGVLLGRLWRDRNIPSFRPQLSRAGLASRRAKGVRVSSGALPRTVRRHCRDGVSSTAKAVLPSLVQTSTMVGRKRARGARIRVMCAHRSGASSPTA